MGIGNIAICRPVGGLHLLSTILSYVCRQRWHGRATVHVDWYPRLYRVSPYIVTLSIVSTLLAGCLIKSTDDSHTARDIAII